MIQLKLIVATLFALVFIMTIAAVSDGGLDFLTPFLGAILTFTWQGQFNLDFASYIILSGLWIAWRSGFTGTGIALGALGAPMGMLFFAPYVLYAIYKSQNNMRRLLLGVHANA